jgi:metal-responsive CopG/Arc/MetJ family transcriptional regulator
MNFSVHMDDKTLGDLTATARAEGRSRSALLTEAFKLYVEQRQLLDMNNGWPQLLLDHFNSDEAIELHDFDNTSDLLPLRDNVL